MFGRIATASAMLVGSIALAAGPALAASPHFINSSASGPNNSGNLSVNFKEAGLGDNVSITYTAHADATALWACINHGGNHPQASNKESDSGLVTASGTFSSGKNGSITATLTLTPPGPSAGFSCPGNQKLVLANVSYTNVGITDTTNNVSASISGTFSRTFFDV